ncbi:recombinase family protein [Candidatus Daviesbacteria bacterium]|nr:recombinase family protein [Candidatus Daviesbacteria bacterium]
MRSSDNQTISENNKKPACLSYCRVSTLEQKDNLSIETQQIKILEKIEDLGGYLAEDCYIDNGISGTSMNRPGLQALLARCSKKDIDYLIVQDSSRISRNTFEYLYIKSELKKFGVKVIPLTGIVDDDPISQTMDEMMAVVNALHPRMTSFKVKQTAAEKFKAGYYPSVAPLGYKNILNPNPSGSYDKKIVVPDPNSAPFITQAFKMYATRNYSIYDIRQYLNKHGVLGKKGRPLQFSVTHTMLRNKFHWGWMHHGGLEGMGKHEPIIDKETFDLVQKILDEKGAFGLRKRKHNFLLRGIVFCKDCGRRYVAEWHYHEKYKTGNGRIGMYHCSQTGKRGKCPSRYVLLTDLEQQVQDQVEKLEFKQDFIDAVNKYINEVYTDSIERVKVFRKGICNRRDAIEMRKEKIETDYGNNKIPAELLLRLNAKLDAEMLAIQKELAEVEKIRTVDISVVNDVLELTRNIARSYAKADIDHKRAYLHFFFQKIWAKDKKIVEVEYTPALQVLNEAHLGVTSAENHNFNTTAQLACTIKTFEDFRLVQQIREDIEKVRPSLIPAIA